MLSRLLARGSHWAGRVPLFDTRMVDMSNDTESRIVLVDLISRASELAEFRSSVYARWLRRHVNVIVIGRSIGPVAAFNHHGRAIMFDVQAGKHLDLHAVAAILVHEVTHARIAAGTPSSVGDSTEARIRIERRCAREELDFLTNVDPSHPLVAWRRATLSSSNASDVVWTDSGHVMRRRTYRRLRELGLPRWMARQFAR